MQGAGKLSDQERLIRVRTGDDVTLASVVGRDHAVGLGAMPLIRERVDLVIRELGWNLVRHAGGGLIRLRGLCALERRGVQIDSDDRGRGIGSLLRGVSGDGLGFVLSAVQRHSDEFTLCSATGCGAHIRVVIWWPSTSS